VLFEPVRLRLTGSREARKDGSAAIKRSLFLSLAVGVTLLLAAVGYLRFGRAIDVPIAVAASGTAPVRVIGPGTVQARVPVTVSARIASTVSQVLVDVGDSVRTGQPLVELDDRDLGARRGVVGGQQEALRRNTEGAHAGLVKAQADLELARSKQRRDLELQAQGFVSQAVVDASNAAAQSAAAAADAARATVAVREADARTLLQEARYADVQLSHTHVLAPMDGMVVQRLVEAGSPAAPGTPLLKLVDPASLWVATRVDESVVARVRPGQPATIRLRSGEVLGGKVARIARQSDAATRELDVFVSFDAVPQRVALDQEAEVVITVGEDRGILVPVAALTRDGSGQSGVLVVVDGRTRFQPVKTGAADERQVVVHEGLAGGETVVAVAAGVKPNVRVRAAGAKP
jgi:HlyD family secretion protein